MKRWFALALGATFASTGQPALSREVEPPAYPARVGAYLEAAGHVQVAKADAAGLAFGGPTTRNLGLRHAQVLLQGRPVPFAAYDLRLEAAGQNPRIAEARLSLDGEWASLEAGLLRAPLGAEFLADDWDLPFLNRAGYLGGLAYRYPIATSRTLFGSIIDQAVGGKVRGGPAGLRTWFSQEDVAARAELEAVPGFQLAAYYLATNPLLDRQVPTAAGTAKEFHDRWGGDVSVRVGPVLVAGELLRGYQTTAYGGWAGQGAHGYALWDLNPSHQVLVRFEDYLPDLLGVEGGVQAEAASVRSRSLILGYSWLLSAGSRLHAQYTRNFLQNGDTNGVAVALGLKL